MNSQLTLEQISDYTFPNSSVSGTSSLFINDRIIWLSNIGPEYGIVRWIGKIPELGHDWVVGVEFDNPVGTGTGNYRGQQLYSTSVNHGAFIPIMGLMKAEDWLPEETPITRPMSHHNIQDGSGDFWKSSVPTTIEETGKHCLTEETVLSSNVNVSLASHEAQLYYLLPCLKQVFSVRVHIYEDLPDFIVKAVDVRNSTIYFSEVINCSNFIIRDDNCQEVYLSNGQQILLRYESNAGYKQFTVILENCFNEIEKKERLSNSVSESNNVINSNKTKELSEYSVPELTNILEHSMSFGDGHKASQVAFQLATHHIKCKIILDDNHDEDVEEEPLILQLYFEDLKSHVGPFEFKAYPSATIGQMKIQVQAIFNFPVNIQRWIIGRELVSEDNSTLGSYDITIPDCPVFIYLLSQESLARLQARSHNPVRKRSRPSISTSEKDLSLGIKVEVECEAEVARGNDEAVKRPEPLVLRQILEAASTLIAMNAAKEQVNWECPECTMLNKPFRPGCQMCGAERPVDYQVPDTYRPDEEELGWCEQDQLGLNALDEALLPEYQNIYQDLRDLDELQYVANSTDFACPVCFNDVMEGFGLSLRSCTHDICKECFHQMVVTSNEPVIKCPYAGCFGEVEEREISGIVSQEEFDVFKNRGLKLAELQNTNSYHCQLPNCDFWVELVQEDKINEFVCLRCNETNCIPCRAIHKNLNCSQYQTELREKALHDENARKTVEALDELLNTGKAMKCPTCTIILQRREGCDWILCPMCKTQICWITKGLRWGPGGAGDSSAGCRCGVGGLKCHVNCNNCH